MDLKKLASDLLGIAQTVAPLIGVGPELNAGLELANKIIDTINSVKTDFSSTDQAALQIELDALVAKVNAHADKTIGSL